MVPRVDRDAFLEVALGVEIVVVVLGGGGGVVVASVPEPVEPRDGPHAEQIPAAPVRIRVLIFGSIGDVGAASSLVPEFERRRERSLRLRQRSVLDVRLAAFEQLLQLGEP